MDRAAGSITASVLYVSDEAHMDVLCPVKTSQCRLEVGPSQTNVFVSVQARLHVKQARLNDAFPHSVHWLTRSLSLASLPVLALAFAAWSLPPMITVDLARPPVLPASLVSIALLAAACAWALLCLVHVRLERNRCHPRLLLCFSRVYSVASSEPLPLERLLMGFTCELSAVAGGSVYGNVSACSALQRAKVL